MSLDCKYIQDEKPGFYKCERCGHKRQSHYPPNKLHRICPASPPSLVEKATNFAIHAVEHVAHGSPKCTQEQIDARLAICQGCEYYSNESCLACGCKCNRKLVYMNKLYHADAECPVGKWGKVEEGV